MKKMIPELTALKRKYGVKSYGLERFLIIKNERRFSLFTP